MPRAMNGWKVCPRCGRELPVSEFHKDRSRFDGLNCWCSECRNEAHRRTYEEYGGIDLTLDVYPFVKDWQSMTLRELSCKYIRSENTIRKWASFLRKKGHNVPIKHHRFDHNEFAWWAQIMNTRQLMAAFGLSRGGVSKRKTRLRSKGYRFPTDDHHAIGNKNRKGKRTGPQFDRARFIALCRSNTAAHVARIEGITPGSVIIRVQICRKEGLI